MSDDERLIACCEDTLMALNEELEEDKLIGTLLIAGVNLFVFPKPGVENVGSVDGELYALLGPAVELAAEH